MKAYLLPLDLRPLERYPSSNSSHSSSKIRNLKLQAIWEFVGAHKLAEYEKMKKGMI